MIEISGLTFSYGDQVSPALRHVDLVVEPGELLLVTGPSGGGKSTLLRCMNGLVPHFYGGSIKGAVRVCGTDTMHVKPRDLAHLVGFVGQFPEDHGVVDRVEDDVAFTLENLGVDQRTMMKRVEEVMDALGISTLRERSLSTLSGGEAQRVAIAGALATAPSFLILDEPTGQLDPQSAEEVIASVLRLRDDLGLGIVMAEHRLERTTKYADRICVVRDGQVRVGKPREIFEAGEPGPPIVRLGQMMGWSPLPLDIREARRHVVEIPDLPDPPQRSQGSLDTEPLARMRGVSAGPDRLEVLRSVDLEVRQGDVVGVMGRNGSGKTTLLRTLAGLIRPRSGHVSAPDRIALVPQNPDRLLFRLSVDEELKATARLTDPPQDASDIALRYDLTHLMRRYPRDLSGGERTRVAIAAACASEPELILLDEPTRGLDLDHREQIEDWIKRWSASGRGVLIATHDVELAASVCDRIVLLARGQVIVEGTPEQTLSGSMTFSTQMNRVFARSWVLTLEDALKELGR